MNSGCLIFAIDRFTFSVTGSDVTHPSTATSTSVEIDGTVEIDDSVHNYTNNEVNSQNPFISLKNEYSLNFISDSTQILITSVHELSGPNISGESSFISINPAQNRCVILDRTLSEMNLLDMKHSDKNKMFKLCKTIVEQLGHLSKELIQQENGMSPTSAIDATACLFISKLDNFSTRYKREKRVAKSRFYVPPEEKAVGTRIEMIFDKIMQVERPRLIQSTLQYISIVRQLEVFFSQKENSEMYFKFQAEHQCKDGVYDHFCCGSLYKSKDFFRMNPTAVQLELAIDDFEICDPLASKSNVHKITGVYLAIKNIPSKLRSKLNNIFLVCLCNADDLKTEKTDINNIWEMVTLEIKFLEETGIYLDNGINLKATLTNVCADNLGENISLCLAEGFRAKYYCRICTMSIDECQQTTEDDLQKYRNKTHYEQMLDIVRESEKVDLKQTFGVKRYCVLNDLKQYHIFENFCVDIMHDLYEGAVSFLLENIFQFLIKNKVFTENYLKKKIKFHQYPKKFRRNKPSIVNVTKHNMGQNATQMKCLFLNLPFILKEFEQNTHLKKVWPCVTLLLRVIQIVQTQSIDNNLLNELNECVTNHLDLLIETFNVHLHPKHHFMLHYVNIIRLIGPLYATSMFRFEAKHKCFKTFARNTHNFVNINKTLAVKHQQQLASRKNSFCDSIVHTKLKPINMVFIRAHFDSTIQSHVMNNPSCFEIASFSLNAYAYDRGSIIVYNNSLFEVEMILYTDENFFFIAQKMDYLGVDDFSQTLKIKKCNELSFSLISFDDLSHKKSYASKFIEKNQFVIIDNRDILTCL